MAMSPLEFVQRLAALAVPRGPPEQEAPTTQAAAPADCEVETAGGRAKRRVPVE